MKVIDLYSGTGGWTQAHRQRGHDVFAVDNDPDHDPDLVADVRYVDILRDIPDEFRSPDVVVASPPCKVFSVAGGGSDPNTEGSGSDFWEYRPDDDPHEFYGPRVPKNEAAERGCEQVVAVRRLVVALDPDYWWMENPRGGLRTMKFTKDYFGDPVSITYCRYGEERMKPTDLWGKWPPYFEARPRCKNGGWGTVEIGGIEWRTDPDGFPCHHSAPRGAETGTQGRDVKGRYRIPFDLSWDVCRSVEMVEAWGDQGYVNKTHPDL